MKELKTALVLFALVTFLTGIVYPGAVWIFARVVVPEKATGSIILRDDRAVGSSLLGQPFISAGYFWGRPSATSPFPNNGRMSSGSNLGVTNPALQAVVRDRIAALRAADPDNQAAVPVDLVTASASGLDPDISPAAADFQVGRVARARGLSPVEVRGLVVAATQARTFGLLGEPRVNVLKLNLALDNHTKQVDDRTAP